MGYWEYVEPEYGEWFGGSSTWQTHYPINKVETTTHGGRNEGVRDLYSDEQEPAQPFEASDVTGAAASAMGGGGYDHGPGALLGTVRWFKDDGLDVFGDGSAGRLHEVMASYRSMKGVIEPDPRYDDFIDYDIPPGQASLWPPLDDTAPYGEWRYPTRYEWERFKDDEPARVRWPEGRYSYQVGNVATDNMDAHFGGGNPYKTCVGIGGWSMCLGPGAPLSADDIPFLVPTPTSDLEFSIYGTGMVSPHFLTPGEIESGAIGYSGMDQGCRLLIETPRRRYFYPGFKRWVGDGEPPEETRRPFVRLFPRDDKYMPSPRTWPMPSSQQTPGRITGYQ